MRLRQNTGLFRANMVLVLGFVLCAGKIPYAGAQSIRDDEPISFVGHGALFGPAGNEIAPTAKFIGGATRWYINELTKNLSSDQKTEFDALQGSMAAGLSLDEHSKLVLNTRLIDWLLDHVTRQDVDRIRGKNNLLKLILNKKLTDHSDVRFPRGVENFNLDPEFAKRLNSVKAGELAAKPAASTLSVTTGGGEAYRAECTANGVPIPPDFGPGSAWVSQGIIPKSELFIVRGDDAEVLTWTSASPKGMCIALPRFNVKNTVEADGVICLSQETSKTCFWDNQVKDANEDQATFEFTRGSSQPFNKWAGGTDLRGSVGGICSDCHAGENPYVIHGKLLFSLSDPPLSLPTTPPKWYDPIIRTGDKLPWPQNPGPMDAPAPCVGCHGLAASDSDSGRLPQLSSSLFSYCRAVLRSSIGALAPPQSGNFNPPPSMPQGKKAGTLACTPGLQPSDPRFRPCSTSTTFDCTPAFGDSDPRKTDPDFPAAYKVSCTTEMQTLLKLCETP